jgi:Alginate export
MLVVLTFLFANPSLLNAQDDVTTQSASSAVAGGWITGPASNPLSYLNGPSFRTFSSNVPYDLPDFHPISTVDAHFQRWIRIEAEERFRYEGYRNGAFKPGNNDSYLLNRFRFQIDIQLRPWLKVVSQLQDARPFFEKPPIGPPNENCWDLKLAYLELGDPEKHWISLRVGRQLINYNSTLIANSEWRNQGRSYDAAIINLQKGRYHLGTFAASIVIPQGQGISPHHEGSNLYGLYGRVDNLISRSSWEPFVLWRVQPGASIEPAVSNETGKQDLKAYGMRWKGSALTTLDYFLEPVLQVGKVGPEPIRAWGVTSGLSYQLYPTWGYPRMFGQVDFASGNNNLLDGVHRTLDTLYPTAHDRFGILDLFGWQNIKSWRIGATITPHRRWTVTAQYLDFRRASAHDAVYNSSGGVVSKASAEYGTYIGHEMDVYSWYELNRHVNIGGGFGRFRTGAVVSQATNSFVYSSPYIAINFKDSGRQEGE